MKRCPRCGRPLDIDTGVCFECGYRRRNKGAECPECGEPLTRGVCYRCGYRKSKANNTCPYCHQKLIRGFCQNCNYKKGESSTWFIILLIAAVIGYFIMKK